MNKQIDPNKVAIYIRWSTEDQSQGTTLETQLEGCKHYILSQGWNINESLIFIDDGYSGGNLERPAITEMRELIEQNKIDCVVVLKLDRLSRNIVDAVNLIQEWENKTALKSAREQFDTDSPIGKLFFNILASFADWERSIIKERTFSGKIKRASEGKNAGFIYPYGYKKGKDSMFEIVPEEAEVVKKIFQSYLNGRGVFGIAADLNQSNIRNRKGQQWSANTILRILENKIYIGILEYGKTTRNPFKNYKQRGEKSRLKNQQYSTIQSQYIKPILPPEIFNAVQEYKKSRSVKISKISGRTLSSEHLLSGILECRCGYRRFGEKVKKGERFAYYNCLGNKQKGKAFCNSGLIRKDILDKIIIDDVKKLFLVKENYNKIEDIVKKKFENNLSYLKNNIKILESNIMSFDSQLTRLDMDYRNRDIDAKTYNRLLNQIEIDKNSATKQLAELKIKYDQNKEKQLNSEKLKQIPTLLEQWDNLSIIQQKELLKLCIDHIVAYKKPGIENKNIEIEITYIWNSVKFE